jgi:Family of unknown function (DUF6338)
MDIWAADKLTLFLIFFIPGFVSIKVYDLIVPGESRDVSKSVFEAITFSTLNFAALFWLMLIIQAHDLYHRHFAFYSILVAVIMIVAPACWPFLFLKLSTWRPIAKHLIHPIRKPWDYVFVKREPFWIIVHLRNGQRIGGRFGFESFASSEPAEEQIYLEEVWALDNEGRFLYGIERSRGIIIVKEEIRAVEFFRYNG